MSDETMDGLFDDEPSQWGPHGEGCDCDPDEVDSESDTDMPSPSQFIPEIGNPDENRIIELIVTHISEILPAHFLSAIDATTLNGCPLSGEQIKYMMAGMMRCYADIKSSARVIEVGYQMMLKEQAEYHEASLKESNDIRRLHGIQRIFDIPTSDDE